ncbi:MAG: S1 family peptidase [Methanosarcinales archaeon]|jgi:hypothetical protein|nr:S1 family peptidase [Methanosarcinales archaeon]
MIKLKKSILLILALTIFLNFSGFAFGIDDIRESTDLPLSKEEIYQLLEKNSIPTDPKEFENMQTYNETIAIFGTVPNKSGADAYGWWISLQKVAKGLQKDEGFKEYLWTNDGPISGYGAYAKGYMTIYICENKTKLLTRDDIINIKNMVDTYAEKENISNIPLIFYTNDMINEPLYSGTASPLKGGYQILTYKTINGTLKDGGSTIGYPAYNKNNMSQKGFTISAHSIDFNVSSNVYQPGLTRLVGTVKDNNTRVDTAFVRNNSVTPIIYVGDDPTLLISSNYSSRSLDNKSHMVVYGTTGPSGEIRKYGIATGNTGGQCIGYIYDTTLSNAPERVLDTLGVMTNYGERGDSGGPVYMGMNVTVSGKQQYQAFIVGTLCGDTIITKNNISTEYRTFVPHGEAEYYLGIKPLNSSTMYLT